ncbi:MAG: tetratricopeptide repeat protein, partial [Gemmatimonadales bacterium]
HNVTHKTLGQLVAALVVGASLLGAATVVRSHDRSRTPVQPRLSDAQVRELDIEFFQARVERDSLGARDIGELARLYLQRARVTGDNDDLIRAEDYARRSLALRAGRNQASFLVLASTLLAQHRFVEAREVAARLVAYDSTLIAARALLGEALLELGEYEEARKAFGKLLTYRTQLGVAPRLARWEELRGRPEEARRLLRAARDQAERRHGMPTEQLAWFHLRLGDLALRHGHLGEAESELEAGLAMVPEDYRLLGAKARLEVVRRRWRKAIEYGERAIAQSLDPATLGLLDDAYTALGDTAKAQEYYRAMALAVLKQPGPFHRAWSLFLLDHDREVPVVLAKVEEEIQTRRDVYGYDLLAWALHKSGRHAEARAAMAQALRLGTRDPMLFHHAGMIERALGTETAAR